MGIPIVHVAKPLIRQTVWRDVIWELPPLAAALASNPLLLRNDWRFFFLLFFLANITGLLFANFL